jgi:protein-L-isoaspartate(D-aspartate) O-methyltransferase
MNTAEKYQQQLLEQTRSVYLETPISEATKKAYLATPRHLFINRYREWGTREWHHVNEENLEEHLATLYADKPLILCGEDDNDIPSTISQPSFVLRMLDMLQIKPGHTIFELGAGSGWNAALMGQLVGSAGHIYSLEILPEVAQVAAETIKRLEIDNVSVINADGGAGYRVNAPYDRAIFTAGAYDLPCHFYDQMREEGLLLIVIKNQGGGDNLFLLQKTGDRFESLDSMQCGFVQLRGEYQLEGLEPISIEKLPEWTELQQEEVARMPFWWGGKGKSLFPWRTSGIRSFLSICDPAFRPFKTEQTSEQSREDHYFGLWQQENRSLVLAYDDRLVSYGSRVAQEQLLQKVREWVDLGMPSAASFALQVYPIDIPLKAENNQWIVKRKESQFVWSLKL